MNAKLEVNGIEESYPEGISNLEKLLIFVMEEDITEDGLIVEVKVDGELYSESYEHQAREVDLSAAQKVEIATETKKAFAQVFLKEAPDYIAQLEKGFSSAAGLLRAPEEEGDGYDMLAGSLETLRAFKSHLDNVRPVLGKGDGAGESEHFWQRFGSLADEIMEAQEGSDTIAIADLLEDKMLPLLEEWREKLGGGAA